jgi:hypothetical protein
MTFIDFLTGPVEDRRNDTTSEDNDQEWYDCMNAHGIATEFQDSIMDPFFKPLRLTKSCMEWVLDTVNMRYRGLEHIQRASDEREEALQQVRLSRSSSPSIESSTGQRSSSATQRLSPDIEQDTALSPSALAVQNAPGFTTLFIGLDQPQINGTYRHTSLPS